jgi:hypothetical protein
LRKPTGRQAANTLVSGARLITPYPSMYARTQHPRQHLLTGQSIDPNQTPLEVRFRSCCNGATHPDDSSPVPQAQMSSAAPAARHLRDQSLRRPVPTRNNRTAAALGRNLSQQRRLLLLRPPLPSPSDDLSSTHFSLLLEDSRRTPTTEDHQLP